MDTSDFISKNTRNGIKGFDIVKEIGNGGGTSQSYIANTNGKEYFLKRLKKEYLVSPLYRNLYVKEYTIGSEIKHPNIVAYHDVVNNDDDCYILMENIVGETLDCFIKSRPDYFKHRANLLIKNELFINSNHDLQNFCMMCVFTKTHFYIVTV